MIWENFFLGPLQKPFFLPTLASVFSQLGKILSEQC